MKVLLVPIEAPGQASSACLLPDFNPIEMAFTKLKAVLRKVAARARDQL